MTREKGFTLGEAVLAMVILGIVTVIAVPKITGYVETMRLYGAGQKMLSDIRYAREMALSRHAVYGIEINQGGNYYQIFSLSGVTKTVLTDPHSGQAMTIDFDTYKAFKGVTISGVSACVSGSCATNDIRFSAFGVPSDVNNTAYTSAATVTLQNGSVTKTVQVTQQTSYSELV